MVGHDVWLGANVTLKQNIIIRTGAVIAANSTVVKDVPLYTIVGGNPAKIIKYRFDESQIERLLASQWWNYAFTDFQKLDIRNMDIFLEQFSKDEKEFSLLSFDALVL